MSKSKSRESLRESLIGTRRRGWRTIGSAAILALLLIVGSPALAGVATSGRASLGNKGERVEREDREREDGQDEEDEEDEDREHESESDHDDDESDHDDDDHGQGSVGDENKGKSVTPVSVGEVSQWASKLCDGTPVAVEFLVVENGVLVNSVSGADHDTKLLTRGVKVSFPSHDVSVQVKVKPRGNDMWLELRSNPARCVDPAPGGGTTTTMPTTVTTMPPAAPTTQPAPPTTPAPTMPATTTTQPATTIPNPRQYLTYNMPGGGSVTVALDDPPTLEFWAFSNPGWSWFAEKTSGTTIVVKMRDNSDQAQTELTVRLNSGVPQATFKDKAGSSQVLTPVSSTTDPGKTAASG